VYSLLYEPCTEICIFIAPLLDRRITKVGSVLF